MRIGEIASAVDLVGFNFIEEVLHETNVGGG